MFTFTEKIQNEKKFEKKAPFSVRIHRSTKISLNDLFDIIEELQELKLADDNALPHIPTVVENALLSEISVLKTELQLFYASLTPGKQVLLEEKMKNYSKLNLLLKELQAIEKKVKEEIEAQ